jgi:hypothetical protein
MDLRDTDVSAVSISRLPTVNYADNGRRAIMPRDVDVSGILHVSERYLRGGANLSISHMHRRANLRRIGSDLLSESDVPAVSVLRRNANVYQPDMCGVGIMPRFDDLSRHDNVRSASHIPTDNVRVLVLHCTRSPFLPRVIDMPWFIHV